MATPAGQVHCEFKAGRMEWDGKFVTPDKRKGKIVLVTSDDDTLTHILWQDREKKETSLDLIAINDAYLEKIEKCKTGRVYLLRFNSSDKKLFFWMQEPKEEGDAGLIKKFNDAIGATIPEKSAAAAASSSAVAGAAAPSAAGGMGADVNPELRAMLQQYLNNTPAQAPRTPPIPLGAVLTTNTLTSLLSDEVAVAEMISLLPETHKSAEGLRECLTSPQLQQSFGSLSQAIQSDQLPVLLAGLGLDASAIGDAPPGCDALEVLCRAMEKQNGGSA